MFSFLCLKSPLIREIPSPPQTHLQKHPITADFKQIQPKPAVIYENSNPLEIRKPLKLGDTGVMLPAENGAWEWFVDIFGPTPVHADEVHKNSRFISSTNSKPSTATGPRVPIKPRGPVRQYSQKQTDHLKLVDTGVQLSTENSYWDTFFQRDVMSYGPHQGIFGNSKSKSSFPGKLPHPVRPRVITRAPPVETSQFQSNMVNIAEYVEKCNDQLFSEQYPYLCNEVNRPGSSELWGKFPKGKTSPVNPSTKINIPRNTGVHSNSKDLWGPFHATDVLAYVPIRKWFWNGKEELSSTEKRLQPLKLVDTGIRLPAKNGWGFFAPFKTIADGVLHPFGDISQINQKSYETGESTSKNDLYGRFAPDPVSPDRRPVMGVKLHANTEERLQPLEVSDTGVRLPEENNYWCEFHPPAMGATGGRDIKVDVSNPEMLNHAIENGVCDGLTPIECIKKLFGPGKGSPVYEQDESSSIENINQRDKDSDAEENFWWLFNPPKAHADELHNSKQ
ncbi:hypothetical protein TVAG_020360 [Trichomonas vaginalis G3]|uniref:Uncharacterized protein n=1 Tax=Trichomonas vaginalis (strain ATCC PRA-98 / G3) TaxID=412133 RepID=A2EXV0_TRIV3|nr:hypothetical protein TVAGG3_0317780 [Trichomonas vaginalis G3]EAY02483.1 hypothetical protein TVAG_020360 [Trichomonas vaginalis G3]KAI5529059.1 hypothetical protein TVAGG3_0317780 [Trichomonas vaginalis G3]|eukprot:XP_001314722.1 hypothetical protein [Trichomonas vaginalis G3]